VQLCVVVWILLLVYKTGLVEQIDELRPPLSNGASMTDASVLDNSVGRGRSDDASWMTRDAADLTATGNNGILTVAGSHEELWKSLSPNHWPTLFAYYNISLTGRSALLRLLSAFVSVLITVTV